MLCVDMPPNVVWEDYVFISHLFTGGRATHIFASASDWVYKHTSATASL